MKELKFKTNIMCEGCLARVKPILDSQAKIEKWEVDLDSHDKILTIKSEDDTIPDVLSRAISKVGFQAEELI